VLLLLVHPPGQRHHSQSEHVHFGYLPSQTEEIHLEIPFLLSPQPIEGPELTPQSNFWTLRDANDVAKVGLEKMKAAVAAL
jgi:hypothetical protein